MLTAWILLDSLNTIFPSEKSYFEQGPSNLIFHSCKPLETLQHTNSPPFDPARRQLSETPTKTQLDSISLTNEDNCSRLEIRLDITLHHLEPVFSQATTPYSFSILELRYPTNAFGEGEDPVASSISSAGSRILPLACIFILIQVNSFEKSPL